MTTAPTATPTAVPTADHEGREVVLELRKVNKVFKDFWLRPRVRAVQDLDLSVPRGEVLGLLGPNGSGKSTTIKLILGLLHPTSGQIAVLGKRPNDVSLKHRIGYLPEESNLYRFLNAEEALDFYGRLFGLAGEERRKRVDMLLEMVGLTAARFRPIGEYSKGMQRRVGLAQALINDPDLLILDEPTTGMDPIATRQIKDLILTLKARGKTIILCTHLLGEVEDVCDRLAIMYGGKLRSVGTVDELLNVENRQVIETSQLSQETVAEIDEIIRRREGQGVETVRPMRQKLETLFLDVIEQATSAGEQTTGAGIGGEVAAFLSDQKPSDVLEELAAPRRVDESAARAAAAEQQRAEEVRRTAEAERDREDVLAGMTTPEPAPATEPTPPDAPPADLVGGENEARPAPAQPQQADQAKPVRPPANVDEDFLSDLTGSSRK